MLKNGLSAMMLCGNMIGGASGEALIKQRWRGRGYWGLGGFGRWAKSRIACIRGSGCAGFIRDITVSGSIGQPGRIPRTGKNGPAVILRPLAVHRRDWRQNPRGETGSFNRGSYARRLGNGISPTGRP